MNSQKVAEFACILADDVASGSHGIPGLTDHGYQMCANSAIEVIADEFHSNHAHVMNRLEDLLLKNSLSGRRGSVVISWDLDAVPGWNHTSDDVKGILEQALSVIEHYNPIVR